MLVLNNLPNVQILNGRSTKDDEDEDEEEDEEERESNENNDNDISNENNSSNNNRNNNRNNHLYPQMEEIEEDKNMENNSNYISVENSNPLEKNNKDKDSKNGNNNKDKKESGNDKITVPKLNIKHNNEEETEVEVKNTTILYKKIITESSNKKIISENDHNEKNEESQKRESVYVLEDMNDSNNNNNSSKDNNNNKKNNYLIDITNEELNMLKDDKYNTNSDFISIIKDFGGFFNKQEKNNENKMENIYINKLKEVEKKKIKIPNYYYFHLLHNKKMKTLKQLFDEIYPYIINKVPELNKNNILIKIYNELFNSIKISKQLISTLHKHIESFNNKKKEQIPTVNKSNSSSNRNKNKNKNNDTNINKIIKEKNNQISLLKSQKEELLKNIKEDKNAYEAKIASLEKENKIMTEKLLDKANNIISSPVNNQKDTTNMTSNNIKLNKYNIKPQPNINYRNHSMTPGKSRENTKFENYNKHKRNQNNILSKDNKTKSPMKLSDNTVSFDNYFLYSNMNSINLKTNSNMNINANKQQLITLKCLKDFMNELYASKENYDIKCIDNKLPKETLEEHMYTFLNKKYGLKNLIIDWARNIINGIKYYSKKDSFVLLFGKIMRNEQEEDSRFIIEKVAESIEELLLYYIKRQNPLKSVNEIKKIYEKKKKSELFEEEWKGIIYSIYEKGEADEIEKKLEIYINKENERKKMEMFKIYKDSRINNNNNKNNYTNSNYTHPNNNSNYFNTINTLNNALNGSSSPENNLSFMKTVNNPNNANNKMSRVEKYNMLLFSDEKNILYSDFMKIVLDNHIRFRDKQLKNFVEIFRSVDTNRDGVINEEEFGELIQRMKIFKEDEVENKIFQYLELIDPFDNQKITFSECVSFFSGEIIQDIDTNGNEKEISVLEKVCFNEDDNNNKNGNIDNNENNNDPNENEQIENNININNNINEIENNNNEDIEHNDK